MIKNKAIDKERKIKRKRKRGEEQQFYQFA